MIRASQVFLLLSFLGLGGTSFGQQVVRSKAGAVPPPFTVGFATDVASPTGFSNGHMLLQFDQPPSPDAVEELRRRGINVLADVPDAGLLVSLTDHVNLRGLQIRFKTALQPQNKISPLIVRNISSGPKEYYLVEFHPDVDMNSARSLMLSAGAELRENPDLQAHQLLIATAPADYARTLRIIAGFDEVGYLFPASFELINGIPVRACGGALTANGVLAQSVPTYGNGWDGPGLNSTSLNYVFNRLTLQLDSVAAQAEIRRAMAEWSKAVKVSWQQGVNSNGSRTVNILWGIGYHGDAYPFDGLSGVLAHTFYPAPLNAEPLAGDLHFDDAEPWHIGANTDLFSVALHELGHALGLGHSDDPSAVMYPYYRMVSQLAPPDIAAIQTLYAAQSTAAAGSPLALAVNSVASATTASTVNLSGSASGGSGSIVVTWASSSGGVGNAMGSATAWTISAIPLMIGANNITVTATSGTSSVSQTLSIVRTTVTGPSADITAPSLVITSPSATTIATTLATLAISGTASDNVGVTSVSWANNFGGSGAATGTANWAMTVPLLVGSNSITIKAFDAAGNYGWRTIIVTRR